jgi:hypothetical protein
MIFISHSTKDKPKALELQTWLLEKGYGPAQIFLDSQATYDERGRYEELADPKYVDTGGIFDIMAVTVIHTHLVSAA